VRAVLDPATYTAAWAEGERMTLTDALGYALGDGDSGRS
jgi:hypothetical protein